MRESYPLSDSQISDSFVEVESIIVIKPTSFKKMFLTHEPLESYAMLAGDLWYELMKVLESGGISTVTIARPSNNSTRDELPKMVSDIFGETDNCTHMLKSLAVKHSYGLLACQGLCFLVV